MELKEGDLIKINHSNLDKDYYCKIYKVNKTRAFGIYTMAQKNEFPSSGKLVFKTKYNNPKHLRTLYRTVWGVMRAELVAESDKINK